MLFAAILIIPVNYYFLYRIFINPPFTSKQFNASLIFLLTTLVFMGYFSFEALREKEIFWVGYFPPVGMIMTVFLAVRLWRKRSEGSE
jgi:hypothetical protein